MSNIELSKLDNKYTMLVYIYVLMAKLIVII